VIFDLLGEALSEFVLWVGGMIARPVVWLMRRLADRLRSKADNARTGSDGLPIRQSDSGR
jgi:hypothetical protein